VFYPFLEEMFGQDTALLCQRKTQRREILGENG